MTWGTGSAAIAVSTAGLVYELTSSTFDPVTLPFAVTQDLNDVEVPDNGNSVRICGDVGVVLFRDSTVWTKPKSQTTEHLFKLSFQSANDGFWVGKQFLILEYRLP